MRADYTGLLTSESAIFIGRQFVQVAKGSSTLERIDQAATAFSPTVEAYELDYLKGTLPGIIVVREDQYEDTAAYCRLLAELGIIRVAFLQSQLVLAQEWSRRLGAAT